MPWARKPRGAAASRSYPRLRGPFGAGGAVLCENWKSRKWFYGDHLQQPLSGRAETAERSRDRVGPAGGAGDRLLCRRQDPGAVFPGPGAVCLRSGGGAGARATGAPSGGRAGGLYHRRMGVLWTEPGYGPERTDPPHGYRAAGRAGHPARRAAGEGARVLDLCAGSGCVGLAVAANVPPAGWCWPI